MHLMKGSNAGSLHLLTDDASFKLLLYQYLVNISFNPVSPKSNQH